MLLRICFACEFHEIKQEEGVRKSHCRKESCWSRYSKCVMLRALDEFLEKDSLDGQRRFSALSHAYSDQ